MGTVRKITMKEIAELSGVGKSTVSRYFNGGYVKEETRKRIASIIQQYNYEPNSFARLKAKSSRMIGIIAPCLDSIVTSQVLMSIDRHLRQEGYSTMIINTDCCPPQAAFTDRHPRCRRRPELSRWHLHHQ